MAPRKNGNLYFPYLVFVSLLLLALQLLLLAIVLALQLLLLALVLALQLLLLAMALALFVSASAAASDSRAVEPLHCFPPGPANPAWSSVPPDC